MLRTALVSLAILVGCTPSFDRPRPGASREGGGDLARPADRSATIDLAPDLALEPDQLTCAPLSCMGCCSAGVCQPGITSAFCGTGGAECATCTGACSVGHCMSCTPNCSGKTCGASSDGCGGTCLRTNSNCELCGASRSCPWLYTCTLGDCFYCKAPDFKLDGTTCRPSCDAYLAHHNKLAAPWRHACCATKCVSGLETQQGPDKTYDCTYCCATKNQEPSVLCQ